MPRLDGFCLWGAGFFIEVKTGFAKRVEAGHLISAQAPDYKNFMAFYYYAPLISIRQYFLTNWRLPKVNTPHF